MKRVNGFKEYRYSLLSSLMNFFLIFPYDLYFLRIIRFRMRHCAICLYVFPKQKDLFFFVNREFLYNTQTS